MVNLTAVKARYCRRDLTCDGRPRQGPGLSERAELELATRMSLRWRSCPRAALEADTKYDEAAQLFKGTGIVRRPGYHAETANLRLALSIRSRERRRRQRSPF